MVTEHRSHLSFADLFCGAGGLSLGLRQSGWNDLLAVDNWRPAVATYARNIGPNVMCHYVDRTIHLPRSLMIVGGPPCQGFSSAGRREPSDQRNSLVREFAMAVAANLPPLFLFENVEGFLTTGRGQYLADLLDPLVDAGYWIHLRKINAANYGVPQLRKRVIVIGALGCDPGFPEPTHSAFGAPGVALVGRNLPRCPTLCEAIQTTSGSHSTSNLTDHEPEWLTGEDLERAQRLMPGQTMRDLPAEFWHASYAKRANRRVSDGTPTEQRGGAPAGVRRLRGDQPCKAITGGAIRDFLHPVEHRPLTIRECARIQTYPDWFVFEGTRAERIQMIGNGVPVLLAEAIGRHLAEVVATRSFARGAKGRLLSFVPTVSAGRSPALAEASRLVEARFSGDFLPGMEHARCL
jgi:DNA (cytosine-5)-methyltransferase 1